MKKIAFLLAAMLSLLLIVATVCYVSGMYWGKQTDGFPRIPLSYLGLEGLVAADVDSLGFTVAFDDYRTTSDPEIIADVIGHFGQLRGQRLPLMYTGGVFAITIRLKDSEDPILINVTSMDCYRPSIGSSPLDPHESLVITHGFKTMEEWEAIFSHCERMGP
jgi:hypothetical protein